MVAVDPLEARTVLTFRNTSKKVITAYSVVLKYDPANSSVHTADCFDADANCWPPGAVGHIDVAPEGQLNPSNTSLIVDAIVFQDGTSDGTQSSINEIAFNRAGRMLEDERVFRIFSEPPERHTGPAGLLRLSQQIGNLPKTPEESFDALEDVRLPGIIISQLRLGDHRSRFAFMAGVRNARQAAIISTDHLRALPDSEIDHPTSIMQQQPFLEQLLKTYRARSSNHHRFCEQTKEGVVH